MWAFLLRFMLHRKPGGCQWVYHAVSKVHDAAPIPSIYKEVTWRAVRLVLPVLRLPTIQMGRSGAQGGVVLTDAYHIFLQLEYALHPDGLLMLD